MTTTPTPRRTRPTTALALAFCLSLAATHCRDRGANPTNPPLTSADLVGTWQGEEGWGARFVITRNADGTFTESIDSSRASVPSSPPHVTAKGRWTLVGNKYSITYTERSDDVSNLGESLSFEITPESPTKTQFSYWAGEGNPIIEQKQ